ncbi:conserved hypothetical protein [Pediculus humanus corporis]|uniref:Potassium channel domain-containing protein n=1 Tax=Pediculus humanus subsp. corporis TaxID=121224 RepID=E0VFX5_PEDHC|nr:uncharacterized protein Phum_PHUM169510 [Pediculus humanus corporis]EEB12281.1 conserved hypothetical protein [Pediculus humanus corporis]
MTEINSKLYPPYDDRYNNVVNSNVKPFRERNKCVHNSAYYVQILFSNIGICALLIGYTFLGSFIFLTIEGRPEVDTKNLSSNEKVTNLKNKLNKTNSASTWKQSTEDFRTKTVENIWEITAALNILYHENWTRLAGQEISKFQDEIIQKLTEEILNIHNNNNNNNHNNNNNNNGNFLDNTQQNDWNFSKSFLYSLTILTTIGK